MATLWATALTLVTQSSTMPTWVPDSGTGVCL
uniref:Uncharacterized protein n=1 Tax=Anguilla anguilla TaxID=7936 RepID=A0A0E9TPR4_ANGAN